MTSPFNADAPQAAPVSSVALTLVNGRAFALSASNGDIAAPNHGVIVEDLRMLSKLVVEVHPTATDPRPLAAELLASTSPQPYSSVTVSRLLAWGGGLVGDLLVRRRWLGRGMREDIEIHNTEHQAKERRLIVRIEADFAHLFDVKSGTANCEPSGLLSANNEGGLNLTNSCSSSCVNLAVQPEPTMTGSEERSLIWDFVVEPRSISKVSMSFEPIWDGVSAGLLFPIDNAPKHSVSARRVTDWQQSVPRVKSGDSRLARATRRSLSDLASLRIFDASHPDRVVVAAGAPWFMTLFGRDSLLSAWMALPFAPNIADGVLHTLAELQGKIVNPETEEEPGKILHELRRQGGEAFSDSGRYYGTVDATPLFLALMGEAYKWKAINLNQLANLWPAIEAAVNWLVPAIESDPHGFVSYQRSTELGLANQGWKDSWDGVNSANGELASGAIGLAEVQGYSYSALKAAVYLVGVLKAEALPKIEINLDCDRLTGIANDLKQRFNQSFWLKEQGWYAVALNGAGKPINSLASNAGHALWAKIADEEKAERYLNHLTSPEMWTGWGLRTLASSMQAYDPLSYHNGSVWPHDTAICAAGAANYGHWELVDKIVDGSLAAADHFGGRPPELFAGICRGDVPIPVAYPSSCSPQAWSSASILFNLQTLVGLGPDPEGKSDQITTRRTEASGLPDLTVDGLVFGQSRYKLQVVDSHITVDLS